jgi:RNA polymerase sigma-70 factor (ECF subfamily)
VTDANVSSNRGEPGDLSSSLLVRVRAQDQAAWGRLVSLYTPLVYRWCRRGGLKGEDAADVGQEVFRSVARKIDDFRRDGSGTSFRAWLHAITRHKIIDHYRRAESQEAAAGGSEAQTRLQELADGALTAADETEEANLLYRRAVELIQVEFEDSTWRAFWRVVIEGAPAGDVATELGITRNAVYLAKARVLRRLRDEFADLEDV